ncbi:helix-turn-helix transcriptional regulator [Curtobacterium sp. MCPF17_021]|uniref:helix-turn-helix domain-containing protein n=1 Tax=Curtobacterium sp. MCPF17_021 TaxID=2175639 RepID=UPI000DA8067C|nr:helix-turn-helix transcriptional regulator [Curtobacterium sp. MCPF17_021]WIE84130.1 helix-turn-helix transcriptional regulator [Curtobacterium sp. MCPF17_021]
MRVERAAELIRAAREDLGLSQTGLAAAAGMQQPTISAYESGRKRPRPESLRRMPTPSVGFTRTRRSGS